LHWISLKVHESGKLAPFRHGQALDLKNDYLGSPAKAGKENAAPHAEEDKAGGNWPEVEIRVASKHSGSLLSPLAVHYLHLISMHLVLLSCAKTTCCVSR
jgi:hypothetical protein